MPTQASKKKPTRNARTSETAKAASVGASGKPSKKLAADEEEQGVGDERHDDVGHFVGDAVDEQVADHVDGLDQVALEVPSRISRAMPPARPGMLENIRLMLVRSR